MTLAEIRLATRRLQRRVSDVEAFDPTKVRSQQDPNIRALEAAIKETLAVIFGPNTRTYRNYSAAATLDTAGLNMNGTPIDEVVEGLVRGKERSVTLLKGAVRLFEEKIEDSLPAAVPTGDVPPNAEGRSDGQVALSGRTAIRVSASAQLGAAVGIGQAGEIRPSIHQDVLPVGISDEASPHLVTLRTDAGSFGVGGKDADLILGRTVIVTAVRTNQVSLQLSALSLLTSLDAMLEQLREERSNSEDPTQYEDLKRRVEEFLAASSSTQEAPIVATTLSLADGLRAWWTKDHASICNRTLNTSLFAGGLSICAAAGALGPIGIVTVGTLIAGKDIPSALEACVKILRRD